MIFKYQIILLAPGNKVMAAEVNVKGAILEVFQGWIRRQEIESRRVSDDLRHSDCMRRGSAVADATNPFGDGAFRTLEDTAKVNRPLRGMLWMGKV